MGKLIWFAILLTFACKALWGAWPWQLLSLRRNAAADAAARARVLLGVDAGASREAIIDAHRRLILVVHPDRGGTADLVHEANAARDLLLSRRTLGPDRA
jgi:hypothetical protein